MNNVILVGKLESIEQVNDQYAEAFIKVPRFNTQESDLIPVRFHRLLSPYAITLCYSNIPLYIQGELRIFDGELKVLCLKLIKLEDYNGLE